MSPSIVPHPCQHLVAIIFNFNISGGCVPISHVALVCIFLKANDVGRCFICVLACIFFCVSFVKKSLVHFLVGCLAYYQSSLYILVRSPF